jgi:hypothetical protein
MGIAWCYQLSTHREKPLLINPQLIYKKVVNTAIRELHRRVYYYYYHYYHYCYCLLPYLYILLMAQPQQIRQYLPLEPGQGDIMALSMIIEGARDIIGLPLRGIVILERGIA